MMRTSTFFLFLLTVLLFSTTEVIASSGSYTHTNTPIELKPTSLENSYQTAAVCFLPDSGCSDNTGFITGGGNLDIDSIQKCTEEGFDKTECILPAYLSEVCPYNNFYYKECKKDTKKACEGEGFKATCELGKVTDTLCPYDSNYNTCKCNPCEGFVHSLSEATAQGYLKDGSCNACGVEKYKRKLNPCIDYRTCECGGEIGSSVCYTGSVKKFSKCKSCCENKCTLAACPAGTTCNYEACSNKYCAIGCATNYTNWCTQPDTNCATMGYKSSTACEGGIKCPYGNAWSCPDN